MSTVVLEQVNEDYDRDGGRLVKKIENLDYDEQPYGDENVLVRSMRRRLLHISAFEL